jgi:NDP-sugar pyrophosphorylase family protein
MSPADCDAVILAGGRATRLQSVVSDRPKLLAEIAGRPFAHYLLTQLARAGFGRAILCTGHMADQVEIALGRRWGSMELAYSREEVALDTAGAVRFALPLLRAELSMVINGDTFLGIDFASMLQAKAARRAAGAMALVEIADGHRFGSVSVSPSGLVTGFVEKGAGHNGPGLINGGIYALDRSLIEQIPAGRRVSLEREMMPVWIPRGIHGHLATGPFIDIGTPESYAESQLVLGGWFDL